MPFEQVGPFHVEERREGGMQNVRAIGYDFCD